MLDKDKIKEHHSKIIGSDRLFQSAVCIPLIESEEGYEILFEVRSSKLDHQPGDICFPGGAIEKGETFKEAAVRELCEELCIDPSKWEDLGENDLLHSDSLMIYPFIGILHDYSNTYNKDEVAEIFSVPLSYLVNYKVEEYHIEYKVELPDDFPYERIHGGRNYHWRKRKDIQYFYQYKQYCIWGLTAKILHNFIENFIRGED